ANRGPSLVFGFKSCPHFQHAISRGLRDSVNQSFPAVVQRAAHDNGASFSAREQGWNCLGLGLETIWKHETGYSGHRIGCVELHPRQTANSLAAKHVPEKRIGFVCPLNPRRIRIDYADQSQVPQTSEISTYAGAIVLVAPPRRKEAESRTLLNGRSGLRPFKDGAEACILLGQSYSQEKGVSIAAQARFGS